MKTYSIVAITNQSGQVVEKRLFDAWGLIVKVQDIVGNVLTGLVALDRGYTSHEHLLGVNIINMNGRIYDHHLHKFLQPDNNIQDFYNTQNYNRYGYVMNNPTKYTDESGEFWQYLVGALFNAYAAGYNSSGDYNPFNWDSTAWTNAGLGAASFAVSTAATYYADNYITNYGNNNVGLNENNQSSSNLNYYSTGFNDDIFDNSIFSDFLNSFYDKEISLPLMQTNQIGYKWGCSVFCKISVDVFFGDSNQEKYNSEMLDFAQSLKGGFRGGLLTEEVIKYYKGAGYKTNYFGFSDIKNKQYFEPKSTIKWAINEMELGRVVQISWRPANAFAHASLISKIKYSSTDESKFIIYLMNPSSFSAGNNPGQSLQLGKDYIYSFRNVYDIFSIWK